MSEFMLARPEPATRPALALYRLNPGDRKSWALWPILEERLRYWVPKLASEDNVDLVIARARQLWATAPLMLGAWLVHEGDQVVGHFFGWVQKGEFGADRLLIYNAAVDVGHHLGKALWGEFVADMVAWKDMLNQAAGREWIRHGRLISDRRGWDKVLGLHAPATEAAHVVEVDLG